ncbi:MAG: CBS domain-containing protein [Burkholderiales bacterium]|jgi:CBS-domain-containing membrane protein
MQAQDVMTTVVATIPGDATVQEAAKLMLERRISALPVMDRKDRVVGIVSEGDLVRRTELGTDAARSWWLQAFAEDSARDYLKTHGASVSDVMTSPAVSVRRTTSLQEIARLLEKHRIKRVPVLDAGRLVGIVSRADLVRRLAAAPARPATPARAASDRALRREVLKEVRRAGIDLLYVNVTVEHRIVHLWGGARSHSEQKALRVAARRIEGVLKVEDHTSVIPLRIAAALGSV